MIEKVFPTLHAFLADKQDTGRGLGTSSFEESQGFSMKLQDVLENHEQCRPHVWA
jgi:hypothetical protein